ncbi:hypothetical protein PEC730217_39370 [Pectobacterium carotovorum subsp. carotovorum]|nr:hypothetical protein [Pectobacterium carotovorum subsp. carotovorum]GKW35157.1 hypothetical protein PEC730217_39370 [Pectobacterium carotovorum subsp. carotovorum]
MHIAKEASTRYRERGSGCVCVDVPSNLMRSRPSLPMVLSSYWLDGAGRYVSDCWEMCAATLGILAHVSVAALSFLIRIQS